MFAKIAESWRAGGAKQQWQRAIESAEIRRHAHEFFEETVLRSFSQRAKERLRVEFLNRLAKIPSAESPFAAFRADLANAGLMYANRQVFGLIPEDRDDMFLSRYISRSLQPYIRQAAVYDQEIAGFLTANPNASDRDLVGLINVKTAIGLYHLSGLQILRRDTNDMAVNAQDDWFRPFVRSMLIWFEELHRKKLGLPSLFDESDLFGALRHSSFHNLVSAGTLDPLAEWQSGFGLHAQAC